MHHYKYLILKEKVWKGEISFEKDSPTCGHVSVLNSTQ